MKRRDFITALAATPAVSAATSAQIDLPGVREQIVHEIQQVFDGKVIWGEDLMRLGLSGSRVANIEPRTGE